MNELHEFLKGGELPTLLIAIAGGIAKAVWKVIKNYIDESKEYRAELTTKLDGIKGILSQQDKEMAVIKTNLTNHIEADEKVQEHIDKNIVQIKTKLQIAI